MSNRKNNYLEAVSKTNADLEHYHLLINDDEEFRDFVIKELLNNEAINIYYHSYLLIEKSSRENPNKYYKYWDKFTELLKHKNSYHNNYAINILANIISADTDDKFACIISDYLSLLNHEKITTRKYCILRSIDIINNKEKYGEMIIKKIIESLRINSNTTKQQNYLLLEFLNLLNNINSIFRINPIVNDFLEEILSSESSEKVKKVTNKVLEEFDLKGNI